MKSPGLGRGLAALIPPRRPPAESGHQQTEATPTASHAHEIMEIGIPQIDRNPEQPRVVFAESELASLAQSIRTHGVIQPLVVTRDGLRFTLVAGERRLQAAQRAGLATVPCVVHDAITSRERLELALIENVQRTDLNPVEQARAYKRLHEEFSLSHEDIARLVGKERPTVSNTIRLLDLPADMQDALARGEILFGHARSLLAEKDPDRQRALFERLRRGELTTRGAERSTRKGAKARASTQQDPQLAAYENELSRALGTRVRIKKIAEGGEISIEYYSGEELSGIVEKITLT